MWILANDGTSPAVLKHRLDEKIGASRFSARTSVESASAYRKGVKIETVRLRNRKDYCGAHPGPCLAKGRRHKTASYLEGLDWVGFNALINDLLDELGTDAHVFSYNREASVGRYYIRRNRRRRTSYPYDVRGGLFAHWTQTRDDFDDLFADYCGKPPPPMEEALDALDGTPGYACYTLEEEERLKSLETV